MHQRWFRIAIRNVRKSCHFCSLKVICTKLIKRKLKSTSYVPDQKVIKACVGIALFRTLMPPTFLCCSWKLASLKASKMSLVSSTILILAHVVMASLTLIILWIICDYIRKKPETMKSLLDGATLHAFEYLALATLCCLLTQMSLEVSNQNIT